MSTGLMMAIDTAAFRRIGVDLAPGELERLVEAAVEEMLPRHVATEPASELSEHEAEALTRGGLDLSPQGSGAIDASSRNALVRAASEYAALIASSYTVSQAAGKLGVDGSRIRQRLAARTIYGIKQGGIWRIPAFQFSGKGLVPQLEQVLPELDPNLSPITVFHWLTSPHPDLVRGDGEEALSPLEWLSAGHPSGAVAELARDLGAGL